MTNLDTTYENFTKGTITLKKFINTIVSFLYDNPRFLQTETMNADTWQDFMVFCHPQFSKIIEQFDETRSSFTTFLRYCLSQEKKRYYKQYYQANATQHAVYDFLSAEAVPGVADPADTVCTMPYRQITLRDIEKEVPGFKKVHCLSPAQKMIIITLKACQFIDADHIRWVAELINMPEKELIQMIHDIRQTMDTRKKRNSVYQLRANHAYMTKKQLQYQISGTEPGSYLRNKLENSLKYQNQLLENYAKTAQDLPPMVPSNKDIAKLLGVTPTSVSHFLTALHDKTDKKTILNS